MARRLTPKADASKNYLLPHFLTKIKGILRSTVCGLRSKETEHFFAHFI
jgi:hypothetical protein